MAYNVCLTFSRKSRTQLKSAFQRGCRPIGGKKVNIPGPVYIRDLFGGKATIIAFGAPFNWNYAGASREEMEAKNPGITAVLEEVMRKYDIKRALVPKPAFNAKVVIDADLPNELLPNFFRGADADGVILERPDDAYFLASADCLAAAIFDPETGFLAALHCGRDALVDRVRLDTNGLKYRDQESVIDAGIYLLDEEFFVRTGSNEDSSRMSVFLAAGIRPSSFHHPIQDVTYGETNERLILHLIEEQTKKGFYFSSIVKDVPNGSIDLFALARHQLHQHGIDVVCEDEFDTATSKNEQGNFLFHSNRRDKVKRNLVIIKLN